ncbi:DNA adenine methylase [Candidatus Persebacteraceae bacterium Df01]|jgi:adenine-specific DNA-methyltransferase|uniref:site-specific DNA-methyltransferase (adenine-specific) n=1 Tax=Candidatus Doriopsillibacter californiensis TaxID=2970740 RepID=A0ABT7QJW4_9GAMM|nr:DNA adenine methylase [Candidatus Persebacteraceae bacterium Df01]
MADLAVNLKTQGIKYAGSKLKIIPRICRLFEKMNGVETVLDGFSGTTRVSQAFSSMGYVVTCNDISTWSYVFGVCYLKSKSERQAYTDLIHHLNNVKPCSGWFTEHYGGGVNDGNSVQEDGFKKPFQIHNTQKLDAIRDEIDRLKLSEIEHCVALTSLILALEKVDNTLGHYVSYLKNWSARSCGELRLEIPEMRVNEQVHEIIKGDVFDAMRGRHFDACYFDPPYGANNVKMPPSRVRYASYYHLWKTVILNDKPALFGAARRRQDSADTEAYCVFEDFRKDDDDRPLSINAVQRLLVAADCRYIVLSYSAGGEKVPDELLDAVSSAGSYEWINFDYQKNVMAGMRWRNEWVDDNKKINNEHLFLIEK